MKTILKNLYAKARGAWQRREMERQLAQLDARMLRDIGLESWKNEQGARLWAHRVRFY